MATHTIGSGGAQIATTASAVNDGNWHFVVGIQDTGSNNRIGISVDNGAFVYATISHTSISTSDPLTLGASSDGTPGHFLNGSIDDARVYNRVLSAGEIASLASGSGPIVATAASSTLSGRTITLGGSLTASGSCIAIAGTLDASGSNYNVSCGTWSDSSTFTPHSDTLTLTNTGILSDSTSFYNLTIDGSGKTVTLGTNLTTTNNLTITAGTLDASTSNYAVIVGGNFSNSGTFTARSGVIFFDSESSASITTGSSSLYNADFDGDFGLEGSGLVGYWPFDESSPGTSYDISAYGDNGADHGTTVSTSVPSTITFSDSYSRSFNGSSDFVQIPTPSVLQLTTFTLSAWIKTTQNGTAQVFSFYDGSNGYQFALVTGGKMDFWTRTGGDLTGTISVNDGSWHHVLATLDGSTKKIFIDGTLDVSGSGSTTLASHDAQIGSFCTGAGSTSCAQYFNGSIDDVRVYNRVLSGSEITNLASSGNPDNGVESATYTLGENLTVSNNLTITADTLDVSASNYPVVVGGNWTNNGGTFTARSGTVALTGTGSQTLTAGGSSFYNLTQNGTGGIYTLGGNLITTNACTITAGTLDSSTSNYDTTCGTWSNSGTFTPRSGTLTLTGTGTLSDPTSFYNLTVSVPSGTVTLGHNLTTSHNLAVSAGTLDPSSFNYSLTVGGNFTNNGTFTPRSATVTLNGTNQSISGSTTFYNLSKTITSADTLTLPACSTTTVTNSLTLQGTAAAPLKLRSSSPGTLYTFNLTSLSNLTTQNTVNDVDFEDATVTPPTSQELTDTNGIDSGNNTNIVFAQADGAIGAPPSAPTPSDTTTWGSSTTETTTNSTTSTTPTPVPSPSPVPTTTPTSTPNQLPPTAITATPTVSQLQQLINSLRSQLNQLLKSRGISALPLSTPTPTTDHPIPTTPSVLGASAPFTQNLKPGDTSPDVQRLQTFLNTHGYIVNPTLGGPGSPGHETDYYGAATAAAVARLQTDHALQILTPGGLTHGTGWFYGETREWVNGTIFQ